MKKTDKENRTRKTKTTFSHEPIRLSRRQALPYGMLTRRDLQALVAQMID